MNRLEYLAATASALALLSSAAFGAGMVSEVAGGAHVLTQEEIALQPAQRDLNRQREFYVLLKPAAAGAADAVQAYFRGFGFATEYFPDLNAVKLLGSFVQAERAGNFTYVAGRHPIIPLSVSTKPSFPAAVESAILVTTFVRGPVMKSQAVVPSEPTTLPNHLNTYGLAPSDYANIYGYENVYKAGFNGRGETVDIAGCFGYSTTDLSTFQTDFGLSPAPNVTAVTPMSGFSLEPDLDVERVYGTAPGAAIRMWFTSECTLGDFTNLFLEIAGDQEAHPAAAFSVSYGESELRLLSYTSGSSVLKAADTALGFITGGAAQKVALFAASGDDGDFSLYNRECCDIPLGGADVSFFASDGNVLAVGGTNLVLNSGFTREHEYAWSGQAVSNLGGSGGGVSNVFRLPPWQKGVKGTSSQKFKNLPDVASNASSDSPVLTIYEGAVYEVWGTSAASPTWAGTVALLQQAYKSKHGGKALTNWPAYFYSTTTRAQLFTDITEGSNGRFAAAPGYDNVTGLGVPCLLHFPSPCVNGK
jgi:subtilase family serine protease